MATTRRGIAATAVLLLSAGLVAAPAPAQADRLPKPRTVNITVTNHGVRMPDVLRSKRYKFVVNTGQRFAELNLVKPDRGYSQREFVRDFRDARGPKGIRKVMRNVRFYGGATATRNRNGVFWETLYAGRYWTFDFASRVTRASIHKVRVHGAPARTRWPGNDARITAFDMGFRSPRVMPRSGKMLYRNRMGAQPHFVLYARLSRGTSYRELVNWLENPQGPPPRFQEAFNTPIITEDVQYLHRYRVPRGRYALLCFFPDIARRGTGAPHAFLGMHRRVRFR